MGKNILISRFYRKYIFFHEFFLKLGQANISEISEEDVTAAEDGQAVSF